jgi:hypothetical protein
MKCLNSLIVILTLCISNFGIAQKDKSFPNDRIQGSWKQIQDTSVILTIKNKKWTFITKDEAGNTSQVRFKVKYEESIREEGKIIKGIGIAVLKNKSSTLIFNIDGIKGSEALYLTNIDSNEQFGYLRLH